MNNYPGFVAIWDFISNKYPVIFFLWRIKYSAQRTVIKTGSHLFGLIRFAGGVTLFFSESLTLEIHDTIRIVADRSTLHPLHIRLWENNQGTPQGRILAGRRQKGCCVRFSRGNTGFCRQGGNGSAPCGAVGTGKISPWWETG